MYLLNYHLLRPSLWGVSGSCLKSEGATVSYNFYNGLSFNDYNVLSFRNTSFLEFLTGTILLNNDNNIRGLAKCVVVVSSLFVFDLQTFKQEYLGVLIQ